MQPDTLILRENEKLFASWLEALMIALLPALILFMLLTKFAHWNFWSSALAFFACDLVFGFVAHSIKINSVKLQGGDSPKLISQTMVLGKTLHRTKLIGTGWAWVRVRMYHYKGDLYLVELGNWGYQCKILIGFGASNSENLIRATEICSKVAKFLNIQDKGFVGD